MAESSPGSRIAVQVCYAPPTPQAPLLIDLQVENGTTIAQAIALSGIVDQVAGCIDLSQCKAGIWNKLKLLDTVLRDHDRIELYRPLVADPKEARRRRAHKKDVNRS